MALIAVVVFPASILSVQALAGSVKPTKAQLETEAAGYYQDSIVKILRALDPDPKREYAALVQVKFSDGAEWQKIPDLSEGYEYLPGTIREKSEAILDRRHALLAALPQKKNVMVTVPADAEKAIEKPATDWIRRELNMEAGEGVLFQMQSLPHKDPDPKNPVKEIEKEKDSQTFHDVQKALDKEKADKEDADKPFLFSSYFWIAIIIAGTFLAGLILILVGRRAQKEGKPSPLTSIMKMMKSSKPKKAAARQPKEESEGSSPATPEELPPTILAELGSIERISRHDHEIASLAFAALASRPDDLPVAAAVSQGFGIDKALQLFPKAGGAVWVKIGDAIASQAEPLTLETVTQFNRAFSAEVAKLQTKKDQVKLLPNIESLAGGEIARRIKAYGPGPGGVALGLLSEGTIMSVVPKLSSNELVTYLQSMMNIPSIRQSEVEKLDSGAMGDGADPVVELEAARKAATALSALPAASEFATFQQLMKTRGERLLAEIAPYRLMPYHLYYLPPEMISEAVQGRELDDLKRVLMAAPADLRPKILSVMTERQRAVAEDGGEPSEHDADSLRSFLEDIHHRNFAGQPHRVGEVFGTRKVA